MHGLQPHVLKEEVGEISKSRTPDMVEDEKLPVSEALHGLRLSAIRGNVDGVKNSLSTGVLVNQTLRGGWTALMYACSMAHPPVVRYLLQQGADPNFHKELFTPLMAVCASSQSDQDRLSECVDLLVSYKADLNMAERHHTTALMFAARQGHTKVVARLLSHSNCCLDAQDSQGWTALFWAVNKGDVEIVKMLVEKNANINIKDVRGQTVQVLANSKQLNNIIQILSRKHKPPDVINKKIEDWSSNEKLKENLLSNKQSSGNNLVHELLDELAASIINNNGRYKLSKLMKNLELDSNSDNLIDQDELASKVSDLITGCSDNSLVPVLKAPNTTIMSLTTKKKSVETSLKNLPYSAVEAREILREMVRHLEGLYAGMSYVRLHMQGSPLVEDKNARISEIAALSQKAMLSSRMLFDEIKFFNQYTKQLEEGDRIVPADYEVEKPSSADKHRRRLFSGYVLATAALVVLYNSKHLVTSLFSK